MNTPSDSPNSKPAGWYPADGDPAGTERYWDGAAWTSQQRPAGTPFSGTAMPGAYGANPYAVESGMAGLGNRALARFLDVIVWILIGVPFQLPLAILFADESADALEQGSRLPISVSLTQLAASLAVLSLVVAYEAVGNKKFGATLGKKVVNTKIVKLDQSEVSWGDHIKRMSPYIGLSLLGIPIGFLPQSLLLGFLSGAGLTLLNIAVGVAGLIMIASSDEEQAPWDKIAGTTVVRENGSPA